MNQAIAKIDRALQSPPANENGQINFGQLAEVVLKAVGINDARTQGALEILLAWQCGKRWVDNSVRLATIIEVHVMPRSNALNPLYEVLYKLNHQPEP